MSSDQDLLEWCRAQRRRAHQQEQADEQASAASNGISDIGDAQRGESGAQSEYEAGQCEFERAPASDEWSAAAGPRLLRLTLMSHRQRFAAKLWPAAQLLSRYLHEEPALVRGRRVLELGAGAALPSICACLLGARATVVTDYPDKMMLANMEQNVRTNVPDGSQQRIRVLGFDWAQPVAPLLEGLAGLEDAQSRDAAAPARYDLLLMSDLLYELEHEALLRVRPTRRRPQ